MVTRRIACEGTPLAYSVKYLCLHVGSGQKVLQGVATSTCLVWYLTIEFLLHSRPPP